MIKSKTVIAAVATSAMMALLPAVSASAADVCAGCQGSRIYNTAYSNGKVIVKDNYAGSKDLWRYQDSRNTLKMADVDYFWVPGGCDAKSQWGYKYVGNAWYGPLNDTVSLDLTVTC